ncbi:hypothetical protein BU17DRAFT_69667 [Hysterangium stoloniferum]|nr:hypothetical protein BU17DRAFT_69667 [Hysterangium stoloniferum]
MLCLGQLNPRHASPSPTTDAMGSERINNHGSGQGASGGGSSSSTQICPHMTVLGTVRLPDELMSSPDPVPRPESSPPDFPEFKYQEIPPPKVTPNARSPTDGHPRRPYRDEAESDGSSASINNPKNQHQFKGHGDGSHVSKSPSSGTGTSSCCRKEKGETRHDHTFSRSSLPLNGIITPKQDLAPCPQTPKKSAPSTFEALFTPPPRMPVQPIQPAVMSLDVQARSVTSKQHWGSDFSTRFVEIDIAAYFEGKSLGLARLGGWESRKTSSVMEPINNATCVIRKGTLNINGKEDNERRHNNIIWLRPVLNKKRKSHTAKRSPYKNWESSHCLFPYPFTAYFTVVRF